MCPADEMSDPLAEALAAAAPAAAWPAQAADIEAVLDGELERIVTHQRARVLSAAQRLNPRLTSDDVLQPDDCPELARDPTWNYEDGVLAGLLAAQIALRAALRRGPTI